MTARNTRGNRGDMSNRTPVSNMSHGGKLSEWCDRRTRHTRYPVNTVSDRCYWCNMSDMSAR